MRSEALDRAARRIVWVRLGGLVLTLVLAGRAAHLTVDNGRTSALYEDQIRTSQPLASARGKIVDRDGRELAVTIESASVYAVPALMPDRIAAAERLAEILDLDAERLAHRLTERERFTYIARWIDAERAQQIRALAIPGIGIDAEPRRSYPAGRLAATLIGFANIDGRGVRGVEQLEDGWLKGRPRSVHVERDARGRALALHSTNPRDTLGGEIALTLDAAMQGAAEAALREAVEAHGALGGTVITIDPKTGDVLALAEAPGFDPNHFRELDYAQTRARAFTDVVEAGSTMKAFLVASALDAGIIEPETLLDTGEGWLRVRGKTIRDNQPYGPLQPADVLRVSSNVGAVQIAQILGRERQHQGLMDFGFGRPTGSGFPTEAAGLVRDWSRWKPVDQATVAFGQGLSVTAIQLASALAALAHHGERMQPRLVLARRKDGGPWQHTAPRSLGQAVSPEAAHRTLDMMRTVVSPEGTGRLAGLQDVPVAGKTGTAQKLDRALGRYANDRYIAWFIGVVPADDPELAIVVAVDEPRGPLHGGGSVAAPLFARVAAAQLGSRGISTKPAPFAPPLPVRVAESEPESGPDSETRIDEPEAASSSPVARVDRTHVTRTQSQPPRAAVAAPPARPVAALAAAGLSPSVRNSTPTPSAAPSRSRLRVAVPPRRTGPDTVRVARRTLPKRIAAAFVPDFSGQTIAQALQIARAESLVIRFSGARDGRVVSQSPVPGTVLVGEDRSVRLRVAAAQEEG